MSGARALVGALGHSSHDTESERSAGAIAVQTEVPISWLRLLDDHRGVKHNTGISIIPVFLRRNTTVLDIKVNVTSRHDDRNGEAISNTSTNAQMIEFPLRVGECDLGSPDVGSKLFSSDRARGTSPTTRADVLVV